MEGISGPEAALAITNSIMNTFQLVALTYLAVVVRRNGK
jgi:hypothetical protein